MKDMPDRNNLWIVATGYIATEMTLEKVRKNRESLKERIGEYLVKMCEELETPNATDEITDLLKGYDTKLVLPLSDKGIFGGLWEMAEELDTGLTVDRFRIPIRQEIIEVAEVYDIDPYRAPSKGNLLIATPAGHEIVESLIDAGIVAAVIGHTTADNARIVRTGDRTTYLTPV